MLCERQVVQLKRGPCILMRHSHAVPRRSDTGADIRRAVHIHEAVGTLPVGAKQSARPMILEAAAENPLSRPVQRGSHCIALARLHGLAIEMKDHAFPSGKKVSSTSLVRVFLSACSHWRQPEP